MSVHEYVSMSLLRDAGVPTPKFGLATTAAEAKQIAEDLDTKDLVIKAQVSNLRKKLEEGVAGESIKMDVIKKLNKKWSTYLSIFMKDIYLCSD